ncbi:MAG: hypothetical protein ACK4MT_06600 [Thermaurantiacus tibetensis]|uniref:hypothetical protein n=1 Tax=Thermaurantiacus tibetensis TaxID=2759035 RepID=UPI00188FE41F|nr:hypothetical protein [Thermaurantiacus tibetensis]
MTAEQRQGFTSLPLHARRWNRECAQVKLGTLPIPGTYRARTNWLQDLIDAYEPRGCTAAFCTTCWGSEGERLFGNWIDAHTSRDPDERAAELAMALRSLQIRDDRRQLIADLCEYLSPERRNQVEPVILTPDLRADPRV